MLSVEPVPAFSDNYIWLLSDADSGRAFVVDPGDAAPVRRALDERGLQLAGILVTHHHADHIGGLDALCRRYNPVVYGPDNPAISTVDQPLGAGDRIHVLDHLFEVIAVPGHTLDHIAYFHPDEPPLLFCGDTLFAGGCGRLFEGTPSMMLQSLQALTRLPPATRVYCAHEYTLANLRFAAAVEPANKALQARIAAAAARREEKLPTVPSSLAEELATNPFLRCAEPGVQQTLTGRGLHPGASVVDVFAALRAWKDTF